VSRRRARRPSGRLLPPVLGLVDGIETALALAAASLVTESRPIGGGLVVRIGVFAAVTAGFVLFVARYAESRLELVRHARELNMLEHGRLAATSLGRAVLRDATEDAVLGGAASFAGAAVPLAIAALVPSHAWLAVPTAVALLAALGVALSRLIFGRPAIWAAALAASGVALAAVGVELRIA
jgi:VIT1/CCC1 family predicted Fe2+/Mn2+ transporter